MKGELPFLALLLVLFITTGFAQTETKAARNKRIQGRVKSFDNDVSNVLIVNLNSKKSTITDSLGLFIIEARLKDTIQFTAVQYLSKEIIITESILLNNSLIVNLVDNIIDLNEVTITPYNLSGKIENDIHKLNIEPVITSSSLGLPNADIKVSSQGERLLLMADQGKYGRFMTVEEKLNSNSIFGLLMIGVMVNSDKIFNRVSGQTELLKNRVVQDQKIEREKEIISSFSKELMSENFDIPIANIDGFLTFCLAQSDFLALATDAGKDEIWAYLKTKSMEFKQLDFEKE